jgi:hypothetical protein
MINYIDANRDVHKWQEWLICTVEQTNFLTASVDWGKLPNSIFPLEMTSIVAGSTAMP